MRGSRARCRECACAVPPEVAGKTRVAQDGMAVDRSSDMDTGDSVPKTEKPGAARRVLQQNRVFLDFFWDIAKPDQDVRLAATENLIQYLKSSDKEDELKYTFKRLVEGLAATREAARPGFSLALAQVLQCFEEIPLSSVLENISEKYNLQRLNKKSLRNAIFGTFFGILALFQSGRLAKDTNVLLQCVQLLQTLAQYREYLKDLPRKTLVDILSEVPESTFEEVVFGALHPDLTSAFSTPEQLQLLLVGIQKFPGVLKPNKLKKLLGSSKIITLENIPKLVDLLKMAAKSVKKDQCLPGVALDLLKISLKEDVFELFWTNVVERGLMVEKSGPCVYMSYRLLGASLPLLDIKQLQLILRSEVMLSYGSHVVSNQSADRFKFAPEMNNYVDAFLKDCADEENQLTVLIGFSLLTNQGYPVVSSVWKVIQHLKPSALQKYIDWLKKMFLTPDISSCLDFSTSRQKENQEHQKTTEHFVFRLRKWIIPRLASIIENPLVGKQEAQVQEIAQFILFHAFFEAQKSVSDIPETEARLSVPLDDKTRTHVADSFFSLLLHLNGLPVLGEHPADNTSKERQPFGFTADGRLWIHCMLNYANLLMSSKKAVKTVKPFSEEQKEAWDKMLQYVEQLQKKRKKSNSMELSAYQQLLLLVGVHLFKTPEESVDLLNDIQNCLDNALLRKSKRKKANEDEQEPEWVEVMVEILLSLYSQPSKLFRVVSRNVFRKICPYMTSNALQLILNVFDPEEEHDEDGAVVITDEKALKSPNDQEEEGSSDEDSSEEGEEEDENKESDDDDDDDASVEDVNEVFRRQLMDVLQAGKSVQGEDSDNELDDDAMMALDENLSALFAEQQKRIQAKKDAKAKIREEKILRKNFKIKVLDLIEVFVSKQSESPLVFKIIEPLISVIEQSMNAESSQLDENFLRKAADIFMNDLCKCKRFCKDVSELKDELHDMIERLLKRASKQSDSSVALYCFSASLFLFKVLKGGGAAEPGQKDKKNSSDDASSQANNLGFLDLQRVITLYQESLQGFMTKRNSPLTAAMFLDLFNRFPFICKPLLGIVIRSIKDGARQHQQGQACTLVMKAMQNPNLKKTLSQTEWKDLIRECVTQIAETLEKVEEFKVKVDKEKVLKCIELLNFLIKSINQQKLDISLTELPPVLQTLHQKEGFSNTKLDDMYWNVMSLLGFKRPKKEQTKAATDAEMPENNNASKKKKGFLPETKKRKNRKKAKPEEEQKKVATEDKTSEEPQQAGTKSKKKRKKRNKRKSGDLEGGAQDILSSAPASKKAKPNNEAQNGTGNAAAAQNPKKKRKRANKKPKASTGN